MLRLDETRRSRLHLSWKDKADRQFCAEVEIKDDPRDSSARLIFFYDVSELHELRSKINEVAQARMIGTSETMRARGRSAPGHVEPPGGA